MMTLPPFPQAIPASLPALHHNWLAVLGAGIGSGRSP